jgi:hypothetical protein
LVASCSAGLVREPGGRLGRVTTVASSQCRRRLRVHGRAVPVPVDSGVGPSRRHARPSRLPDGELERQLRRLAEPGPDRDGVAGLQARAGRPHAAASQPTPPTLEFLDDRTPEIVNPGRRRASGKRDTLLVDVRASAGLEQRLLGPVLTNAGSSVRVRSGDPAGSPDRPIRGRSPRRSALELLARPSRHGSTHSPQGGARDPELRPVHLPGVGGSGRGWAASAANAWMK